jgi:hypothetical protein
VSRPTKREIRRDLDEFRDTVDAGADDDPRGFR